MLTYATILVASIIVAVLALVLYRVVMHSSKSVLSSKEPISLVSSTPGNQKAQSRGNVTGIPASLSPTGRTVPASFAGPTPAMPSGNTDWGWQGNDNKVREQHPPHSAGAAGSKHCSLFDVDPGAAAKRDATWPHREEKSETAGKSYKVTRKARSGRGPTDDSGKPWGW